MLHNISFWGFYWFQDKIAPLLIITVQGGSVMKVAIIGSGISGLTSAFLLKDLHEITIFDKNDYAGGHTHTIDVHREEGDYAVDTGFIVFNRKTYPNFCKILDQLEVQFQPTRMDFSVKSEKDNFEYNARTLQTLFSSKRTSFLPPFTEYFWTP